MSPKTYLITGATAGIGLATAKALTRQGATVVAVGRNAAKGREITARIRQETGNAAVEFLTADLSSQAEVRRVAQEFRAGHARLDVLVNNVGGFFPRRQLSADGIEMTWALNYLGVYLLTELLLPTLTASAPARIVNVSSDMHRSAQMNFDDLQGARHYSDFRAYGQSKLALVLFTYELARQLAGTGVTANALHPGFVATDMYRNSGGLIKLVAPLIKLMAIGPDRGAETSVYLATSPEVEGITGQYFVKKQAVRSGPASYDTAAGQRLMQISAEMTGG
ncbi:MAG: SDR family oxidoreductase [Chloroflexi bacterium]|nr:SDR family oxidoreductase [Chloroflexota bacterium]